jgi:hypothetical protein
MNDKYSNIMNKVDKYQEYNYSFNIRNKKSYDYHCILFSIYHCFNKEKGYDMIYYYNNFINEYYIEFIINKNGDINFEKKNKMILNILFKNTYKDNIDNIILNNAINLIILLIEDIYILDN